MHARTRAARVGQLWKFSSRGTVGRRAFASKVTRSQWPASKPIPTSSSSQLPTHVRFPALSKDVEGLEDETAARRLPIKLLSSVDQCKSLVDKLFESSQHSVAIDTEGMQLGRFGKLSLVQLATDDGVFLIDVEKGGPRVLEPLAPLLESDDFVKVFHDCREDASVLFHRYGLPLKSVFDTQVGFAAWLERRGLETYQASIAEILRTFRMSAYRLHRWDILERRPITPSRWHERPLPPQAVRYAVEGVVHLLPLQKIMNSQLGDPSGTLVQRRSARYLDYVNMNRTELPSADISALRPGSPIQAMLASSRPDAAYFKLNHAPLTGVALEFEDWRDFADLQPGDIARCQVKSVSSCKQFVHLQREGHGQLLFDRQKGEMRKLPATELVDQRHPRRPSSLYGFGGSGAGPAGEPGFREERATWREPKPEVIHKLGKRGNLKIKKTGFTAPAPQRQQ